MMPVTPISDARSPLSYARRYARIGWRVFPLWWARREADGRWACACGDVDCRSPAKHPISRATPTGQNAATTDLDQIEAWWGQYPQANIGVLLAGSSLVAIDIDPRNGGLDTIAEIESRYGQIESDVLQFTGGGGEHRVFAVPAGQSISLPGKLGPGVDVKHNGYIVVEPSNHVSGRQYAFEASSDPLDGAVASPLPDWIRDLGRFADPQRESAAPPARPLADAEIERLRGALAAIPANDREIWLRVGMALHNDVGGQSGFELWCQWSAASSKFDPVDQLRVWRSFRRRPMGEAIQLPSVYALALEHAARTPAMTIVVDSPQAESPRPRPSIAAETPAHLLTIPGKLALAVDWINATARKHQPLLSVQAAIALGSVVTGRRYRSTNGNWTMLYLVNVAESGAGKEHAKYAVETLLEAAHIDDRLIGHSRFASESGVLSSLIERPAQFSVLDEFGRKLQSASVAQNWADRNTLTALMEVWSRDDGVVRPVSYSTAGMSSRQIEDLAKRIVRNPSMTLLGLTTPESLFAALTSGSVADGFLNRLLIVYADHGRQVSRMVDEIQPPAALIEWIGRAHTGPQRAGNLVAVPVAHDVEPVPIVMAFDTGARAAFSNLEQYALDRANELDCEGLSELVGRWTEMAMRLSVIAAVSLDADQVSEQAARWSCDYVRHHGERNLLTMRERLSDGPFDLLCKEIARLVRRTGNRGATERDLNIASRVFRASPERMRSDALLSLQRRDEIALVEIVSAGGRGRRRRAYISADSLNNDDNDDKTMTGSSTSKT